MMVRNKYSPADYALASVLADEVGNRLCSRLEWMTLQPKIIVDSGCGVGQHAALLKQRYPNAKVFAVDNDLSMLQYAAFQNNGVANWLNADAFSLPFFNQSVDLIFANLLLPWCVDLQTLFNEWRRVLRPEGLLIFTTFGPDTLQELRDKLPKSQLLHFVDMHDIGDMLTQARWADPVLDVEYIQVTYQNPDTLIEELQKTGMIQDVVPLEKNADGIYSITFEIVFGHAWGPDLSMGYEADEEGVVRIPLAHLRRK